MLLMVNNIQCSSITAILSVSDQQHIILLSRVKVRSTLNTLSIRSIHNIPAELCNLLGGCLEELIRTNSATLSLHQSKRNSSKRTHSIDTLNKVLYYGS